MGDRYLVPSSEVDFISLSRTKTGRLFKKHVLTQGDLIHPKTKEIVKIDDQFVSTMRDNFFKGVVPIVQVPLAGSKNEHTEDPTRNIGEVVDVQAEGGKVYAYIDARDETHANALGKTLLGASALIHQDYFDSKTGQNVGPALLHVCVTNRPYVQDLEDYEEIAAAAADTSGEVVLLTAVQTPELAPEQTPKESEMPTLEEMLAALKTEHNIDVDALTAEAAKVPTLQATADAATGLTAQLAAQLKESGLVELTPEDDDKITTADVVGAVAELAAANVSFKDRIGVLELSKAESEVQHLIDGGYIMPAKKDTYVQLRLTQPDTFAAVVPDEPVIKMSVEQGVTPPEDESHQKRVTDDLARLTATDGEFAHYFGSSK